MIKESKIYINNTVNPLSLRSLSMALQSYRTFETPCLCGIATRVRVSHACHVRRSAFWGKKHTPPPPSSIRFRLLLQGWANRDGLIVLPAYRPRCCDFLCGHSKQAGVQRNAGCSE